MSARILGLSLTLLLSATAQAESMRCGQFIVDETTSLAELLSKCGEPTSKETSAEDVLARNPDTGFTRKIGTKITERWRYQRSNRVLPMTVTIVDGKVIRLERTQ
jgi:hypothetical protein